MTIRDVTYTNDVCRLVLSRPQGAHTGGTSRVAGTSTTLTETPYGSPSLELDFTKSTTIDPSITFTRDSVATFYNSQGYIETASINQPRIQFNPDTKQCLGLLIEPQSSNLITQSEWGSGSDNGFTFLSANNTFNTSTQTVPTNSSGTTRALVASNTVSSIRYVLRSQSYTAGEFYVWSGFFKNVTSNNTFVNLIMDQPGAGAGVIARFNLLTGVVEQAFVTGTGTYINSGIEKLPNGWCRCWLVGNPGGGASGRLAIGITNTTTSNGYDPAYVPTASGDGVYVWGIQFENFSNFGTHIPRKATSYMRTTGSGYLRPSELAQILNIKASTWFNPSQGTALLDYNKSFSTNYPSSAQTIFMFTDSGGLNIMPVAAYVSGIYGNIVGGGTGAELRANGVSLTNLDQPKTNFETGKNTVVMSYRTSPFPLYDVIANGSRTITNLPAPISVIPAVSATSQTGIFSFRIILGNGLGGTGLNDCISRFSYYPFYMDSVVARSLSSRENF